MCAKTITHGILMQSPRYLMCAKTIIHRTRQEAHQLQNLVFKTINCARNRSNQTKWSLFPISFLLQSKLETTVPSLQALTL